MKPLGDRRRAEELARLLDGAVAGPTLTTRGYAMLATRLRAVAPSLEQPLTIRPEFRATLRQRLLAVATVQAAQRETAATPGAPASALQAAVTWTRTWKAQRGIALTAGAMAGVIAFTGVGIASSRSLPGQPFYGLKRASEGLQLDLAGNDTAKGTKHLEFAATRLREVHALAVGDTELTLPTVARGTASAGGYAFGGTLTQRINNTLRDFDSETADGRTLLEGVYRSTGKTAPLRILAAFSSQQQDRLATLIPDLPAGTADTAQASLNLVADLGTTAAQLLSIGSCTEACNPANGGPTLPVEPAPAPGTSASPSQGSDNNGVPGCGCGGPTPMPTPEPTTTTQPQPTTSQSPSPSTTGTPAPGPSSTPTPSPTLPVPLPTIIPTILPTGIPTSPPPLPIPVPTILPSLAPLATKP